MGYCEKFGKFVWFHRISSSKIELFPYMETGLPYIDVSQNMNFLLTLILIHKNLLSLVCFQPYHLTEYFKRGIVRMVVENEKFRLQVS